MDRTQIIERALGLAEAVTAFVVRAKRFYYAVALCGYCCPKCGGPLHMEQEGFCMCRQCGYRFDPAVTFQCCPKCGGGPRLRIRRYECALCGAEIVSRFLFDNLILDAEYFRQKMAEHRQRKRELRDRVREVLAESRSGVVELPPADFDAAPDLLEALNGLGGGGAPVMDFAPRGEFNLSRYQRHIQAHIQRFAISLDDIPPLSENARIDRIWRFIAIIFLAHAGILDVRQDGQTIMVMQREADREGQDLPGDLEAADGVEGSLGRVET